MTDPALPHHTAKYPADLYPGEQWKMTLCPECGSKRCNGAIDHRYHGSDTPPPTTEQRRLNAIRAYAKILTDSFPNTGCQAHIATHLTDILDGKADDDD